MDTEVPDRYKQHVRKMLPLLKEGIEYKYTSPVNYNYNCLSWALSCDSMIFEKAKGAYWPWSDIADDTASGWASLLKIHGFEEAATGDVEAGCEKVAIFEDSEGNLHAARSDSSGRWKSKLGDMGPDIDHIDLESLEPMYGRPVLFLKRRRPEWKT